MASPTTTSPSGSNNEEISADDSKRMCDHMNKDHGDTVYLMASTVISIPSGWHITGARIQKISLQKCSLQVFVCRDDMCEQKTGEFPFQPPLQSKSEARKRLVAVHHDLFSPQWYWLFTKPMALIILVIVSCLGYVIFVVGISKCIEWMDQTQLFPLGLTQHFAWIAHGSFWFATVAHSLEGLYAWHHCRTTLQLDLKQQFMWFSILFLVGYPVLMEFKLRMEAARIRNTNQKSK